MPGHEIINDSSARAPVCVVVFVVIGLAIMSGGVETLRRMLNGAAFAVYDLGFCYAAHDDPSDSVQWSGTDIERPKSRDPCTVCGNSPCKCETPGGYVLNFRNQEYCERN